MNKESANDPHGIFQYADLVLELKVMNKESANRSAIDIVTRAINAAGQAGGIAEIQAIAAKGPGAMTFSDEDAATLLAAYGSPGDAMYAIQLEAQRQVSAVEYDFGSGPGAVKVQP